MLEYDIKKNLFFYDFSDRVNSENIANNLKVSVGDKIKIAIPKTDKTLLGNIPRFKTVEIIGIFDLCSLFTRYF